VFTVFAKHKCGEIDKQKYSKFIIVTTSLSLTKEWKLRDVRLRDTGRGESFK